MRHLTTLFVLAALAGSVAHAGGEKKKAEAHYLQGETFFEKGLYEEAIVEYEAAYALVAKPLLLYNIARAYHELGDKPQALDYYKRYLEEEPKGKASSDARDYVAALTVEIKAEKSAAEARRRADEQVEAKRQADEQAEAKQQADEQAEARRQADTQTGGGPVARTGSGPRAVEAAPNEIIENRAAGLARTGRLMKGFGWVVAGFIGGVFGGAGLGLTLMDRVNPMCGADDPLTSVEECDSYALLFSVGAAGVVGGGVLWYFGYRRTKKAKRLRLSFVPSISQRSTGMVLVGSF